VERTIIEVAIPVPVHHTFSYLVPYRLEEEIRLGQQVLCPFGARKEFGYVVGIKKGAAKDGLKEIASIAGPEPIVAEGLLSFLRKLSWYYHSPLGEVMRTAVPLASIDRRLEKKEKVYIFERFPERPFKSVKSGAILEFLSGREYASRGEILSMFHSPDSNLKALIKTGCVRAEMRRVIRDPFKDFADRKTEKIRLNQAQKAVASSIVSSLGNGYCGFLLYGVTGSGKTEVYIEAISHVVESGKGAIMLVPEIALTPQMTRRFYDVFGGKIAVLHSMMNDGERYDTFSRIRRGDAKVVIGARSAIFAPLKEIGIIVVDEEHDASYKQEEKVRYNARDMALMRGAIEGCPVVLGSATPSLESFSNVRAGKLKFLSLPERVESRALPDVEIVDMRFEEDVEGERLFSKRLLAELSDVIARGEQAIIFLNRRGFANFFLCKDCGNVVECPQCGISMTYHRKIEKLLCHYCDFALDAASSCPKCESLNISLVGFGTERVEEALKFLLPGANVGRLDSDSATSGGLKKILNAFTEKRLSVLVGTQILAKGHDFPDVTLVGVLLAELGLKFPDFRASERTFQLLTQVAGRAGRGDKPGKVIIQTYDANHYTLRHILSGDYNGFIAQEDRLREERGYPPYRFLSLIEFIGKGIAETRESAGFAVSALSGIRSKLGFRHQDLAILGPSMAPLFRLKGKARGQVLLKAKNRDALHEALDRFTAQIENIKKSSIKVIVDVDPVNLM